MVDGRQSVNGGGSSSTDITCDFGENFGNWTFGNDELLAPHLTSANIACGFHAGDPTVMRNAVKRCLANDVRIGAHVGFPDLRGFGRREMAIANDDLRNDVIYQFGALEAICAAEGTSVTHVKPHGALYDMAVTDRRVAETLIEAMVEIDCDLPIFSVWNSAIHEFADDHGVHVIDEVYADRSINADGSENPGYDLTQLGGSVEAAAERVVRAVTERQLAAVDGSDVEWSSESICIHSDTVDAVPILLCLTRRLADAGVAVAPYD